MNLRKAIFSSQDDASIYAANYIVDRIVQFAPTPQRPFVLGLPTGSSPIGIYRGLVRAYQSGRVSFANVVTFNMDEYVGLEPLHPQSYHYFMYENFFNHVDIRRENIHILDGLAKDIEKECSQYEATIAQYGRINLFLGGLGPECHIAFNEAGSARDSKTRMVDLAQSTIDANCRFFENDKSKVPKHALSVGISTILDNSDEIVLIVLGSAKKMAFTKTISLGIDPKYPSTYLSDHKNVLLVCDTFAAGFDSKL